MSSQVWYLRIGEQRGRRRIYVEGARLLRAGVRPGQPMRVDFDDAEQVVRVSVGEGSRRVSQRKRGDTVVPVIDISNETLASVFGKDIGRVRVVGANGQLEVSVHPDEAAESDRRRRGSRTFTRQRPLRVGSLFHGGGILDHAVIAGLEDAGIPSRLDWAVEFDPRYLDASIRNNPAWNRGGRAIQARVEEVGQQDISQVDLLIAGIPCTGASLAGRAKNHLQAAEHHETAGSLFVATLQAIQSARPAVVLLENVPPYANTLSMHVLRDVLATWGYALHETVLNGLEYGALEDRNRLAVVAITRGLSFDLDWIQPIMRRRTRLAEILDPVPVDSTVWREFGYLRRKEDADRAAGKGFRMQIVTPETRSVGTIGRGYAKGRSTEPLLGHPDDPALLRQFSPVEHARIKGVSEQMIAGLPVTVAHELLGQSVIFPAFRAVGRALARAFGRPAADLRTVRDHRRPTPSAMASVLLSRGTQMRLAL